METVQIQKGENGTQTTAVESPNRQISLTFKPTQQQCIETIKLSYIVSEGSCERSTQKLKDSFIAANQQQQPFNIAITKQSFKSPQRATSKNFSSHLSHQQQTQKKSSDYYNELSEELFLFNSANKRWERSHMELDNHKKELIISSFHVPIIAIEKLKIFRPKKQERIRQVKVTYTSGSEVGSLLMNICSEKSIRKLPVNYVIFQQILAQKLSNQNTTKQTKWTKQPHICEQVIYQSYIFGEIYKKSQYLGKWEKRYIVLNGEGVFSYRSWVKKQESSFGIERKSIEYLWTRFDMIDNFLIIKLKHGIKQTQFGIPITNYNNPHFKNWLYYFYKLMDSD